MTLTIGAHVFSTSDSLNIGIVNSGVDQYTVLAQSAGGDLTLELFLEDNSATAFNGDGLPLSVPLLGNFTIADFHLVALVNDGQLQVDGNLTSFTCGPGCSPIPEPSSGLLAAAISLLLAGIGGRRRFRRK